jgi:hypothetical protein
MLTVTLSVLLVLLMLYFSTYRYIHLIIIIYFSRNRTHLSVIKLKKHKIVTYVDLIVNRSPLIDKNLLFYPEYSREISNNSLNWLKL